MEIVKEHYKIKNYRKILYNFSTLFNQSYFAADMEMRKVSYLILLDKLEEEDIVKEYMEKHSITRRKATDNKERNYIDFVLILENLMESEEKYEDMDDDLYEDLYEDSYDNEDEED